MVAVAVAVAVAVVVAVAAAAEAEPRQHLYARCLYRAAEARTHACSFDFVTALACSVAASDSAPRALW